MQIVLATNNAHKLTEVRAILAGCGLEVASPADLGLELDVEEVGVTFRENALLKAMACHRGTGLAALGDDSGLVVEALAGRPGVLSARYAGRHGDDAANTARVLAELAALPGVSRAAAFVCSLAWVDADGGAHFFEGRVEGEIASAGAGSGGFGYDPVFFLPQHRCTMAELPFDQKNTLSHRRRALDAFVSWWQARGAGHAH